MHGRASWTKVRENAQDDDGDAIAAVVEVDDTEEPIRTVKDETSRRVCQTRGQLGTNARNGVAIPSGRGRGPP
uniref:Uncharacterized protein n=2 Tax=Oryza TaxID=4527 RepID=A0A0E0RB41_ORYRU